MKTIGLIGGMSWESSAEYYRLINEIVKAKRGGLHSAKCVLFSVDFHEMEVLQKNEEWPSAARLLADAAQRVERAGADLIVLCTNTMHRVAKEIASAVRIPFLHIADAMAEEIRAQGIRKVGLLGTRYTMEQDFYKGRLKNRHGIDVMIPGESDRQLVHDVIYNELCLGQVLETSRIVFAEIIDKLVRDGAEGIVLGCTEIPMLVHEKDASIPLLDTTRIHAQKAVEMALG